jgi:hypothetical protein
VRRSSKCFYSTVALTLNHMCVVARWDLICWEMFSDLNMMMGSSRAIKAQKSDSMIMRIMLRALCAIHRRHKSSLQSVCKPSKKISFKFLYFRSKYFNSFFLFACWFFVKWEWSLLSLFCCAFILLTFVVDFCFAIEYIKKILWT